MMNDGAFFKGRRGLILYGLKQAPRQWNKKFNSFMANEKTESIVICVLTVKMYFRLFLRSGRITPPNWTRAPELSIVTTPHMDYSVLVKT
ncbi:uncharacterized protein LOC126622453 isoform X5 [Malus sylvestris]|uniref:uncharacterized protein LOC126622453 isoform X4 n=1 Tax=Malus sylvestris TaxID=3752 RepID=UPI0021ABC930|nr:uncharacterized protein LOC126622453 isoform X4 [Malus sylvestris]XP_050147206.1 uncharacterized protein LOC126622453 isoform X5 [Malus sylvestris]